MPIKQKIPLLMLWWQTALGYPQKSLIMSMHQRMKAVLAASVENRQYQCMMIDVYIYIYHWSRGGGQQVAKESIMSYQEAASIHSYFFPHQEEVHLAWPILAAF